MTTDLEEPRGGVGLVERRQYDGDASEHLEDLVVDASLLRLAPGAGLGGNVRQVELVGQHLRLSGQVVIGNFSKLSDYLNAQQRDVLLTLNEVTVLRRSGEATRVKVPSLWINLDDVTLIAELDDVPQPSTSDRPKVRAPILVVTPGHTLTGEVHLAAGAELAIFVESKYPRFLPMTDVRTRSLADRRVIERYTFAVLNRDHIVATAALPPGMAPGKVVL